MFSFSIRRNSLENLRKACGMTKEELKKEYEKFMEAHPEGKLNQQQFIDMMQAFAGVNAPDNMCTELFDKLDSDHSGFVDFNEYIAAVASSGSDPQGRKKQLALIFRLYDADSDGHITLEEMISAARAVYDSQKRLYPERNPFSWPNEQQVADAATEDFKRMDKDGDGKVTLDEFTDDFLDQKWESFK